MMRFVVDAGVVIQLATEGIGVHSEHQLLAPTLLRSQVLSELHEAIARGEIAAGVGLERHGRISKMPIRLLGDGVLRRRTWQKQLQADAFVTLDADLARRLEGIVTTASIDALRSGS